MQPSRHILSGQRKGSTEVGVRDLQVVAHFFSLIIDYVNLFIGYVNLFMRTLAFQLFRGGNAKGKGGRKHVWKRPIVYPF